ncbi:hypothetical protein INR49_007220 [Caranx melampygus]|nr:hypothetical protein INR49_022629 [Caranx melampygus]KAG7233321.1 hypothetical protein INR49_007220 [Caranx melampygus]
MWRNDLPRKSPAVTSLYHRIVLESKLKKLRPQDVVSTWTYGVITYNSHDAVGVQQEPVCAVS